VLGANDGIVSTAAVVVGVAGATSEVMPVFLAAFRRAGGWRDLDGTREYVSVSSQRDSEHALIEKERGRLRRSRGELAELVGLYEKQGLSPETAATVAAELTAKDALKAHLSAELNIDQDDVVSPWHAALASRSPSRSGRCCRWRRSCSCRTRRGSLRRSSLCSSRSP
jgi:VIT1/CCC1 family predicted Fe2+/Mn2+ transporter